MSGEPIGPEEAERLVEGRPSRDEMLERVPLEVEVWDEVDLDSEDPAFVQAIGRRLCIATTRAGKRCSAPPRLDSLLCAPHAGELDPRQGGLERARLRREARVTAEERARLAALGPRGAIAETLAKRATDLQRAVDVLIDAAAAGDLAAAKLLGPFLNQGLGLPTERVEAQLVGTPEDVAALPTAELVRLVRERRHLHSASADAG